MSDKLSCYAPMIHKTSCLSNVAKNEKQLAFPTTHGKQAPLFITF